jgi:hypothetical protein
MDLHNCIINIITFIYAYKESVVVEVKKSAHYRKVPILIIIIIIIKVQQVLYAFYNKNICDTFCDRKVYILLVTI